jgi:hypothetical protein
MSILGPNHKSQVFCYDSRNTNFTDYYLVPDLPHVTPPIPHRPQWKGVGRIPNQAPPSLIEVTPKIRQSFESNGFLPHTGEYQHYASAIQQESSLRNLDVPLSRTAFENQRILGEFNTPSHPNVRLLPNYRAKGMTPYEPGEFSFTCGLERKYDQDGLNQARFNNSTKLTTRNMKLPHIRQTSQPPLDKSKPGYVPSRRD